MTEASAELVCANCGRQLDPSDKFCRDCGLPTMRQAQRQKQIPALPPDTGEMKRALNAVVPEPKPFLRAEPLPEPEELLDEPETTSDVLKATSPTQTTQMATATTVMLVMIVIFAIMAVVFLVLAFRL